MIASHMRHLLANPRFETARPKNTEFTAAYPRLQGYWGNQARTRGSWVLGSKEPLPKTEKSADLAHDFSGVAFFTQNKQNPT